MSARAERALRHLWCIMPLQEKFANDYASINQQNLRHGEREAQQSRRHGAARVAGAPDLADDAEEGVARRRREPLAHGRALQREDELHDGRDGLSHVRLAADDGDGFEEAAGPDVALDLDH